MIFSPGGGRRHQLEEALERADQAIVQDVTLCVSWRETAAGDDPFRPRPSGCFGEETGTLELAHFQLVVEGAARDWAPILRDEV